MYGLPLSEEKSRSFILLGGRKEGERGVVERGRGRGFWREMRGRDCFGGKKKRVGEE